MTNVTVATKGPLTGLFAEAERQMNICNACRYCEGYCAVFPALERRRQLDEADLLQLANLCHDCRACLYACMYAPPHEFAINPPQILSEIRGASWAHSSDTPSKQTSRWAATGAFLVAAGVVVALSAASEGISRLWSGPSGARSPYSVISYAALITVMIVTFVFGLLVMGRSALRYWMSTRGKVQGLFNVSAWHSALIEAAQLRYLKGGGADCQYPTEVHSPIRRYLHGAVAYGFVACLVATIAAGISQDILGNQPPYSWVSVPVIAGLIGGIGLVVGSIALAIIKTRSDPAATDQTMVVRDYRLLAVLTLLGATGLATLFFRTTAAYGILLTIHLATVAAAFALAPFTKFNHVIYRLLALVEDNLERKEREPIAG